MSAASISLACIHGVNTGPTYEYVSSWGDSLAETLPDTDFFLKDVRWRSLDNPVFDWLGLRLSPAFRVGSLIDVSAQLSAWMHATEGEHRCVVAHSMGVPLAMKALADLRADVPFVGIGSPMTHPILGPRLERVGFGRLPTYTPPVFSNREDFICALWTPFKNWWRDPKYLQRREVSIDAAPYREHDAEKYLALEEVASTIKRAALTAI